MKLQEIIERGYALCGWMVTTLREERRVVLKLGRNKKFYVAHAPFADAVLADVEFTEPVLLK